ncbi:hypothetical protein IH785_02395 [candidate division KSB1 bacterium]|nr:hypothetical protein [candidate division KSB1 bacterium]
MRSENKVSLNKSLPSLISNSENDNLQEFVSLPVGSKFHPRLSEREVTDACLEYLSMWREESKVCGYQILRTSGDLEMRE